MEQTATNIQIINGPTCLHLRDVGQNKTRCGVDATGWLIERHQISTDQDSGFRFCKRCGKSEDYAEASQQNAVRAVLEAEETERRKVAARERAAKFRFYRKDIATSLRWALVGIPLKITQVKELDGKTVISCEETVDGETIRVQVELESPDCSYLPACNDAKFRESIGW